MSKGKKPSEKQVQALVDACFKLKLAHDSRWARVRKMQELAKEARRTGQSQAHRMSEVPDAFDISDSVDEILLALKPFEPPKDEKQQFWDTVDKAQAQFDKWPEWKQKNNPQAASLVSTPEEK